MLIFVYEEQIQEFLRRCVVDVYLVFVVILKKDKIPFGPSISIASAVSMLWGNAIVAWYLGLFL